MRNIRLWRHIALLLAILSFGTLMATAQSASVVQVLYPNGSAILDPAYRNNAGELKKLEIIYKSLLDSIQLGYYKMSVIGYGSENQSDAQYQALGAQRAQTLRNYLINKLGASEKYFRPSAPYKDRPSRFDVVFLSFTSPNARSVEIVFIYADGQNRPPRVIARETPSTDNSPYKKQEEKPLIFVPQKDGTPIYEVENWHFNKPAAIPVPPTEAPELATTPKAQPTPPPTDEYLAKITGDKPKLLADPTIKTPDKTLYTTPATGQKIAGQTERKTETKASKVPDKEISTQFPTTSRRDVVMPVVSLNTNLLYWAALNYNAELEIFLRKGVSLAVEGQYAYAEWGEGSKKYYISAVSPELRIWFNRDGRFTGHTLGFYLQAGQYDMKFGEIGHQGDFLGAGISYNYTLPVGYRTAFRFGLGVGYARVMGKTYHSLDLPHYTYIENEFRNYIGPTKASISFVWRLGTKKGGWR